MIKNIVFDFGRVLIDYDYLTMLSEILPGPKERSEFYAIFCSAEFCKRFKIFPEENRGTKIMTNFA